MFIVESIARGTRWAAFDENLEETWAEVRRQVESFFQELHEQGALSGVTSKASCYVICDSETNRSDRFPIDTSRKVESKKIIFCVGFAMQGSEFAAFRFVHDAFECRVDELGWQPRIIALAS
jgi:phage tail sheath protein FI